MDGYYWGGGDSAWGDDYDTPTKENKPETKDPLVIQIIEVLKLADDELLVVRYPVDTDHQEVQQFAQSLSKAIIDALGMAAAKRIILLPDSVSLEKVKMPDGPKEHELYPSYDKRNDGDGDCD